VKRKKIPAAALVLTITGETLLSVHHSDAVAPQPHIERKIPTPPATTVSVISTSGGASAAPFALDSDDWGALPFRTTYDSHTNLRAVLAISQDGAIGAPRPV
jgi:hypothetical protein